MRTVAAAIAFALVAALARETCAHSLGISRMELDEQPSGAIRARFTFAAREADAALDRDGHVAVDVRSDDEPCAPGAVTTTPDGDGVVLEETFACTKATRSLEAIAYFVTQMSGSHEDVAILQTPEGTHEELLSPSHRAIRVALSRPRRESPHRSHTAAILCAAAAAVALLAFAIRSILRK
ncbi:MAG TPA: hypothetical protein VGH28_20360 [Polyangiaceae bacterium]|jgi:hypothetical protein